MKLMPKRYHIYWSKKLKMWGCHDMVFDVLGLGATVQLAWDDCKIELETLTSDLHK